MRRDTIPSQHATNPHKHPDIMTAIADNNRRIAKNTLFLYMRMLLIMAVTLYTSRVVLNALGVVDFGVYNVVGGIVTMMAFLNGSISAATQRFLAFAIGKQDKKLVCDTFSTAVILHVVIAVIVLLIAETVGLWFFYNYLNIPAESLTDALWVYQCSVATTILTVLVLPYSSLSISYENMKIYAYLSILEAVLKLLVAFLLIILPTEKLKLYAILILCSTGIISIIWLVYTNKKYPDCRFRFQYNRKITKDIAGFLGWQAYGSFALMIRTQGVNVVLNIFFGPVLNAARGIAVQVNAAIMQVVQNFQMASNPQITKYYAAKDTENINLLIMRSSKISFLLMFIISLPILLEAKPILVLWLKIIPDYGVIFVQLMLLTTLTDLLSGTLVYGALATGKIKKYQLVLSSIFFSDILFVYIAFKLNMPPETIFYIEMALCFICLFVRLAFLKNMISLSVTQYLKDVTLREIAVGCTALALSWGLKSILNESPADIAIVVTGSMIIAVACSATLGLNHSERSWAANFVRRKLNFIKQ